MAAVLYRYAARHALRVFSPPRSTATVLDPKLISQNPPYGSATDALARSNMFLHHVSGPDAGPHVPLNDVIRFIGRIVHSPRQTVTLVREPLSHALSHLCYYMLPADIYDVERLLFQRLQHNVMAQDFGITNEDDFETFAQGDFGLFDLVCITEYFDECLVMMRRRFNWDMLDITYIRLLDSEENGFVVIEDWYAL